MRYFELLAEDVTNSSAFKAWFAGSKIVDKKGRPLKVFHGTNKSFEQFRPLSHFGTSRAANQRLSALKNIYGQSATGNHVWPVYLKITNPLRVQDFEADDEATLLNGIIRGGYPDLDPALARREGAYEAAKAAGYDGLVYRNGMEDQGKDSWVIFSPDQVKSALSEVAKTAYGFTQR